VASVFVLIGASFGPVCGAMVADYLLAGRKWSGPRAGFNPAGWISWLVGFAVGGFNMAIELLLKWTWLMDKHPGWKAHLTPWRDYVYMPPVTAFVIGFGLYLLLSVLGARTRKLDMPAAAPEM
jgi:cytosine permease